MDGGFFSQVFLKGCSLVNRNHICCFIMSMQSITSLVTLYFKVMWGYWGSSVHNCVTWV